MTEDFPAEPTVDELLTFIYNLEEAKEHREAGYIAMLHIEKCLSNEGHARPNKNTSKLGFPFISELLEKLDVTKVHAHCMIGTIRSTFRVRQYLTNWEALLEKIKDEMIRRDMDYKSLLRGLI